MDPVKYGTDSPQDPLGTLKFYDFFKNVLKLDKLCCFGGLHKAYSKKHKKAKTFTTIAEFFSMLLGTLFYHVFNIIKVTDVRQEMSLLSLAFFHSYIKGKSTTSVQAKKVTNYGVPLQLMQMDTISKGNMDIVIQKNVKKVILKIKVATAISTTSMVETIQAMGINTKLKITKLRIYH